MTEKAEYVFQRDNAQNGETDDRCLSTTEFDNEVFRSSFFTKLMEHKDVDDRYALEECDLPTDDEDVVDAVRYATRQAMGANRPLTVRPFSHDDSDESDEDDSGNSALTVNRFSVTTGTSTDDSGGDEDVTCGVWVEVTRRLSDRYGERGHVRDVYDGTVVVQFTDGVERISDAHVTVVGGPDGDAE